MRRSMLCLAVTLALAFAPAPLPRRERGNDGDDLKKLQGDWLRVEFNGRPEVPHCPATIRGDRMQFSSPEDAWIITLDATQRPRHVDFVRVNEPATVFRGVYRLEGDTLTYSLRRGARKEERARDFETTRMDSWVGVYKRKK